MKRYFTVSILCALLTSTSAFAADAIKPTPMAQDKMPAVGEFRYTSGQEIPVPVITWGADLATSFANGNSKTTRSGSIFDQKGLSIKLQREDNFREQVRDFRSGDTPFLRGTVGMMTAASQALCDDKRTCPQIIYNLSRSAGGDILMGNTGKGVTDVSSLRGKTIGLQLDGPHMDLLIETLSLSNMTVKDVNIKFYRDLGFDGKSSAAHAFAEGEVDAAFVIFPDALELTEGDAKMKTAKNIFSTKSLDRVIYDVYAVRPDFAKANPQVVTDFTNGLLRANEAVSGIMKQNGDPSQDTHLKKNAQYQTTASAGAELLFGVKGDVSYDNTVMEMYRYDLKMQGWTGNANFLVDSGKSKGAIWYGSVIEKSTKSFIDLGLLSSRKSATITAFPHDFNALKAGLNEKFGVATPQINTQAAAKVVERLGSQGVQSNSIESFEILFEANQMEFSPSLYAADFDRILQIMSVSGGAVVAVEGHSGTLKYLKAKHGSTRVTADQMKRISSSSKALSVRRAQSVVQALQDYAKAEGYDISFENIIPSGRGITNPKAGMCNWNTSSGSIIQDPCGADPVRGPGAAERWKKIEAAERRVVFTLVNVEGEADIFTDDF